MVTGNEYIFDNIDEAMSYVLDCEKMALRNDIYRQEAPKIWRSSPITNPPIPVDSLAYPLSAWFNDVADDKFVITRLKSGRYSLKPNLCHRQRE